MTKKKIQIAQTPKTQPEKKLAPEIIVGALASLEASQGWAIIVGIINDNITYLDRCILEKIDPLTKEPFTDAEVDILRTKRSLNIDLKETPSNYSKVVLNVGAEPENYDPYFKTNDEIKKYNRLQKQD